MGEFGILLDSEADKVLVTDRVSVLNKVDVVVTPVRDSLLEDPEDDVELETISGDGGMLLVVDGGAVPLEPVPPMLNE